MAEQKKKTTAAGGTSGSRTSNGKRSSQGAKTARSSGTAKKSASNDARSAAARKRVEENRIRRRKTRGALVLLALCLFTVLGYFNTDGIIIKFLRGAFTGLFGGGFYILPPALLLAAVILVMSGTEPAGARVVSCVCLPLLVSAFCQLFSKADYALGAKMWPLLWADGKGLTGGGVLGGTVEIVFALLFSKVGAAILFVCLMALAGLSISGLTLRTIVDMARDGRRAREEREYEGYLNAPEPAPEAKRPAPAKEQPRVSPAAPPPERRRAAIDIPMDGDEPREVQEPAKKQEKRPSFFNKTKGAPAPDSLFERPEPKKEEPEQSAPPEPAPRRPEPEPEPEPAPAPGPEAAPEPVKPAPAPEESPRAVPRDLKVEVIPREPVPAPQPPAAKPAPAPLEPERAAKSDVSDAAGEIAQLVDSAARRDVEEALRVYQFPTVSLLNEPVRSGSRDSEDELRATRERLELCLRSFGVNVSISNIVHGPSITRYEMELEIGVKLNKLTNLADDIALALGVTGVRIAAIPNRISTVGIEVPNKNVSTVYLREIITAPEFRNAKSKLTFAIGKNISGDVMVGNISKLPHLLVAGTTGSGKSVCLNSLILSLMYKASPDEVKFIMIDPKMVEFKIYNGIPHLLIPVVTEAKKAAGALQWAVVEMMKRYRLFSDVGARDIAGYNEQLDEDTPKMPQIVVIIDELADLMMIAAKEVEESICRVAQMGRAAGVHLVIATQSPRADVITGLMKANIPSRIALKVASSLESRIILDAGGAADKLVGNGDMLYAPIGVSKPVRIQGTWVSDEERERVIEFVKQSGEATYSEDVIHEIEKAVQDKENGGKGAERPQEEKLKDYDELLPQAADIIFETNQASVSMLQRRLKLGYARAARIVDQLEEVGVLGPFEGSKPRQIIITRQQWQEMQFINGTAPVGAPAPPELPALPEDDPPEEE